VGDLTFFADRSLGDYGVPAALRGAGWQVVSMRERYGSVTAQALADIDWIRDATAAGEVLLTGDKAIAKRPLEARAVVAAAARVFALGKNQLTGAQKAQRFLDHEQAIFRRASSEVGPYVVSVSSRGLQALKLFA
jgi:PIN like domain